MQPGDPDEWARPALPPTAPYPQSIPPYGMAPYPTSGTPYSAGPPYSPPYLPTRGGYPQPYQPPIIVNIQPQPTSGFAVAAMVLGILGLVSSCCSFGVFSVLAVIFGHLGLNETKNGGKSGQGMAVAGLVMG
jgi:uncharacterized protein DUF4190